MKRMRKLLLLAVLLLVTVVCPLSIKADSVYTTKDGQFKYTKDSYEGVACIIEYLGNSTKVTVPDKIEGLKVKEVGGFEDRTNLESVSLPSTVETISDYAFTNCVKLKSINLSNVTYIGKYAFADCTGLESVNMGSKSRKVSINGRGFMGCTSLKYFDFKNVTAVGGEGFYKCSSLKEVTNTKKLYHYGVSAFAESGVEKVSIDYDKESGLVISNCAFEDCTKLKKVSIYGDYPCQGGRLGFCVFEGCTNLESAYFSTYYNVVGYRMFANSGIKYVIVDSGTMFDSEAFEGCDRLADVYITGKGNATTRDGRSGKTFEPGSDIVIHAKQSGSAKTNIAKEYKLKFEALKDMAAPKLKNSSKRKVSVSWKKYSGASEYYVYRATGTHGSFKKIATVKGTKYVDKKVKKNKTYRYKIGVKFMHKEATLSISSNSKKIKVKK